MRILIVDDRSENLYLLEILLKGSGYEVVAATNGAEALEKLHANNFDLIISDILMPVMDGFQLCHEVKKEENLKGTPFVFYTATYTNKKDENFALQLGADLFIRKPMDPDKFIEIIHGVLGDVKEGKIKPKEPTVKEEEETYKLYSERLVKKLEKKMLDLEREIAEREVAEKALRESEERYRELADSITDTFFAMDEDLRYTYWNKASEELTGIQAKDAIGKSIYELFPEPEGKRATKEYLEVLRTHQPRQFVNEYQLKGKRYFLEISAYSSTHGISVFVKDVTERKRTEDALRESEVRYRTLFEGAAEGILVADIETKQFKYANPAICKMLGYTEEELKSMGVSDIHPQEDLEWVISEFEAQARRGKTLASTLPGLRKSGTVIYVDVNTSPIVVDGRESNVGFFTDITDRKAAEDALRESENKYKTLVENIPQKVFLKDKNSVYISCNENYARDLKIKSNEIVGKTDYDFHPKELADKYRADDKRVIESGKEEELEEKYITDGREVWVNTIKTPVEDRSGNVIGVLGIFWDITDRKQVEEERELLIKNLEVKHAEMERFVYTISHELRTPLVTLRGYTGLLLRDLERGASEKVATDLSFIERAAGTMAQLLEDTLELSRTGRVMNPSEDVSFSALVRDSLVLLTDQLTWGRVDVAVAEDFPIVHVDRTRLVEVLVNLIENSIKFMGDQPKPKIEIGYRTADNETVFFVKDNGIGLDKSQHEKVFALFYKVGKKSKGSGAGLAIVKRIIEVHGGRIWIESELGKGCTVCFTLPVV
jgi:PAS domain S-box-containing protein